MISFIGSIHIKYNTLSRQHSSSNSSISSIKNKSGKRKIQRILLVDDEPDIITSFKIGLEGTGLFEVEAFTDPQLALSNFFKVGLGYYDLLLIDIKMQQMNGFELYQKIKHSFEKEKVDTSTAKVCFITAYEIYYETLKKEFPTLNTVGCFIKKPIAIEDLINRVKQELQLE